MIARETELFHKPETLFNRQNARYPIQTYGLFMQMSSDGTALRYKISYGSQLE